MLIGPIIFFTIVLGIAGMNDIKKVGRVGGKALLYFEILSTLALIIGVIVANVIRPGDGFVAHATADTSKLAVYQKAAADMNWVDFITHIVPSNILA
jgi:aerobic C4-dicarboxylate transport protein